MSESRYIVLDVGWDESRFVFSLSEGSQLAWIKLLCQVRRDCLQNSGGKAKRMEPIVASRKWGVGEESVVKMEAAALEAGVLKIEDGNWVVTDWHGFQGKDAERKRKQREKVSRGVTDTDGRVTDGREGKGKGKVIKKEPSVPKKDFGGAECPDVLQTSALAWQAYKRAKRQDPVRQTWESLFAKYGQRPLVFAQAVAFTIEKGWHGLQEPNGEQARETPDAGVPNAANMPRVAV